MLPLENRVVFKVSEQSVKIEIVVEYGMTNSFTETMVLVKQFCYAERVAYFKDNYDI